MIELTLQGLILSILFFFMVGIFWRIFTNNEVVLKEIVINSCLFFIWFVMTKSLAKMVS